MRPLKFFLLLTPLAILNVPTPLAAQPSAKPAYNRDIRPILVENCFACHGPDSASRKAGLRLDHRELAVKAGVIDLDRLSDSEVLQRIFADNPKKRMPPQATNKKLTDAQKDLLRRWIVAGAEYQLHWSYLAPVRPEVPKVKKAGWVRNPIDAFILAKLEERGLEPTAEADRRTIARRLSLDLTGLPPAPDEVEAFVTDKASDAYDKLVTRWLDVPQYGEHRARIWLDAARYADTHGLHFDNYREMSAYRDWVIASFNRNQPFHEFTVEQLAGDLLQKPSVDQLVATGFHRCNITTNEGGSIDAEVLAMYAKDRVETTATVWLGLTAGCASCHDHKFDAIPTKEFYQFSAFFRNTTQGAMDGNGPNTGPVTTLPGKGTTHIQQEKPGMPKARILFRGQYDQAKEEVTPGVFAALNPLPKDAPLNRLGLARWLVAPENPLMARVTVNRFWQEEFGTGLVRTTGDFGVSGELPSHPELLDWLAVEFRESGWDVKKLLRLYVTSATYRQAAIVTKDRLEKDPANTYLSRGPRERMDAEMIRDNALAVSGLLVKKIGGKSVKPYQPAGVWDAVAMRESGTRDYKQDTGENLYRRSMYTFWKRAAPPASMEILNAPSREFCTVRRDRTNTPLQALVTLNDPQFVEAGRHLAQLALKSSEKTDARIDFIARRLIARPFRPAEMQIVQSSLDDLLKFYRASPKEAQKLITVGESRADASLDVPTLAAWTMLANQLMNLDEVLNK